MKYEPMPKLDLDELDQWIRESRKRVQRKRVDRLVRGAVEAFLTITAFMCFAYAIREVLRWVIA